MNHNPFAMDLRWMRVGDKILYTDGWYWNPDEPDIVDWYVAWWL